MVLQMCWLESFVKLTNAIIENDDIAEDIAADYIGCIKDMYSFEGFKQFTAELDELQELDNEHESEWK